MEPERLMQAVLQSFLDADLRVEMLPRSEDKCQGRTADTGTGLSYDVTTQAHGHGQGNNYKMPRSQIGCGIGSPTQHPDPVRTNMYPGLQHADSSTQAVDGQYASVYKVHHCKMTPTSPPPFPSEFPPQRSEVFYGCDNFQVGGPGSGETTSVPVKASGYRGAGLNWPNRSDVYTPRLSQCSDPFASSLRKYPFGAHIRSPEHSAEVLERLVTYAMPRAYRSPQHSPYRSPYRSPRRSPQREPVYRKQEDPRPRAPEEYPTREKRDEYTHIRQTRKQPYGKHEDIRQIGEISRKLRKNLKSISSYTHTHTLSTFMDGMERDCDTPIPETSETDHEDPRSYPVNTTVQAVVTTTSLGVEAKPLAVPSRDTVAGPSSPSPSSRLTSLTTHLESPVSIKLVAPTVSLGVEAKPLSTSRRTVAISITPTSSRLSTRAHDVPSTLVTKSVQTFHFPGRSVETVTSNMELPKQKPMKHIPTKSKSLSDFRLKRDFKSEILEWLDDTTDAKIKEIKDVVLKKLSFRLRGISTTGADKIKVKISNCLKSYSKIAPAKPLSGEIIENNKCSNSSHSQDVFEAKDSSVTDQTKFNDIIKEKLNDIYVKNHEVASISVEKYKVFDTFIDKLKYLAIEKSKYCSEQAMREEILRILDEVLIEASDKAAFLNKSDVLMCKLDDILLGNTRTKSIPCDASTKSDTNSNNTQVEVNEKVTKASVVNEIKETTNPDVIKQTIVDLVDVLKDSISKHIGLEEIASTLHNITNKGTKLTRNCENTQFKSYATNFGAQPLTVFMVQHYSRNFIKAPSDTNMSQHSNVSIVDRDIETNSNRYKTQLAQRIEQWLTDFSFLRAKDMDFKQAVVLNLAGDIVDRQKYLNFNKNKSSEVDELEHLKYLLFKWMKRYLGEENMDMLNHAVELMEMIRMVPVPRLCRSQDLLCKSNPSINCEKSGCAPGTSTRSKDNVYNSKSDSGIHESRESHSDFTPSHIDNQINSNETLKNKLNIKGVTSRAPDRFNTYNIINGNALYDNISQSNNINKERQSSEDSFVSSKSREDLDELYGDTRRHPNDKPEICKDDVNTLNYSTSSKQKKQQNDSIFSNNIAHNCLHFTKKNYSSNKKEKRGKKNNSKNNSKDDSARDGKNESENKNALNSEPKPSGLVTPVPLHSGKQSSAAAQLIAEWRPTPVFTPPPPGRPLIDQVHEEFKYYLNNWCQQIPIPACTDEEVETAEKSRLGILNGIWKMLTKLKSQPAVFQNKFYYEDVLGKEIDGLLDCLPQTQELKEKRYTLKSQLLEKISDMNDLFKEIEVPDNYKEIVAQKSEKIKDQKYRRTVRTNLENPTKIMEELLKYCTLDDFLKKIDYKEPNKFLEKAYKNRLLNRIQAYMNELKETHGKEMEELCDVWEESDIFEELKKVPLPTSQMTKEEADEIVLGLEIEEWMMDLPIVKNDDGNEQRQRERLRDSLTRKIHEMDKRANISDCCGNTEVRHEISLFLDMVPLERDQDLHINEMVGELTDRLRNRQRVGGRRKSVAFQDGSQYQDGNQSCNLLNRSNFSFAPRASSSAIYEPEQKRVFQEDSQNFVPNGPLCSTRIEQPNNWAMGENEDYQYRAFGNDASFASIIEPISGHGRNPLMPPDFRCSLGQAPQFEFPQAQNNENIRRNSLGYHHLSHPGERYQYPNAMESPKPVAPLSDSQYHTLYDTKIPRVDHQMASGIGRGQVQQNEPSFVSLEYVPLPRSPQILPPAQGFSNAPYSPHRSQMNPNMSLAQAERVSPQGFMQTSCRAPQVPAEIPATSCHSAQNAPFIEPQPYMEPRLIEQPPCMPNASRFSRSPRPNGKNESIRRPEVMEDGRGTVYSMRNQGPIEVSVQVHEPPRARQHPGPGFVSLVSHQRPNEMPLETSRNKSVRQPIDPNFGQPSIRILPAPEEIQEVPESGQRSQVIQGQGQVPSRQTTRNQASREPSVRPEISNRPVFASTPRNGNIPPHNVRERQRIEQEGSRPNEREVDAEEADEGEERCHCRSRFNRWSSRPNCHTCDDCIHGRYYPNPYMFPPSMCQPYMYPPFGRPPYPPCRR